MHPRAIETRYAGYRFRSRLEARYAVFFDALGLKWEYEPEGFELPGGVRYLPDFRLHGLLKVAHLPVYFEVKPSIGADDGKAALFSSTTPDFVVLLDGPPDDRLYPIFRLGKWWGQVGFTKNKRLSLTNLPEMKKAMDGAVLAAAHTARSARFEHGERGAAR